MYINSIGCYVPEGRVFNDYFKDVNGLTDDWIVQRTGIRSRSKASSDENVDTMGLAAVEEALKGLPYPVEDVDLIVAAAYSVYDTVATTAHMAQQRYKINGAKVFYLSAACSSFINGMEVIDAFFKAGKATKALIICSEHNTYYSNESDPKSGHLWGDGAVAFFVSKEKVAPTDIEVVDIYTEGLGDIGKGPGGVKLRPKEDGITMPDGRDVFIHACRYMIHALRKSLGNTGLEIDDLKHIICHQANKRIVVQVAHQLEQDFSKFLNNIEELGNTGSASAPLVFVQNREKFTNNEYVALIVFGGGYSCGSMILKI